MAKGLLGFLGFGKREKPNLVSPVARPAAESLYFNKSLRDLASSRMRGEGLGFGDDFVDKATNPVTVARTRRLREETIPTIANEASARGINRSSLTVDRIGRAERDTQNDIDQLISNFEVLNRQQKKTDFGQGLQLGQNLDQQQAGLLSDAAAEGERVRDLTVGQANSRNAQADQRRDRTLQAIGTVVGSAAGGPIGASIGGSIFKGNSANSVDSLMAQALGNNNPAKANVLGSSDDNSLIEELIKRGLI